MKARPTGVMKPLLGTLGTLGTSGTLVPVGIDEPEHHLAAVGEDQRPQEPQDEEYQTLFTIQIVGITVLVLSIFLAAPVLFPLFGLDTNIRWTLLFLLLCPLISSFGTTSCVKLERELRYPVFARIDIRSFSSEPGISWRRSLEFRGRHRA